MVSTQDSESCDPSSNLGRTWIFSEYKILFEELFPFPHLWHSKCDKPLFIFHNCSIQALALTFIKHLTFKPAHTLWTITVCLSWSIVGSVVECSPATRAARVRFPDDANFYDFSCCKQEGGSWNDISRWYFILPSLFCEAASKWVAV